MIEPHGGTLVNRVVAPLERADFIREAEGLTKLTLASRQASDAELVAVGAFSPLAGFMGQADYLQVLRHMRLASGVPWPLPVTLSVEESVAASLPPDGQVKLHDENGRLLGTMVVEERFPYDKEEEAHLGYGTTDASHPGVANVYSQGPILLGGPLRLLQTPKHELPFADYRLEPAETRREIEARGWNTVVGFQTRNPVHRAHEYMQKCALEVIDGLLLHPLVGETKSDDIPADVRMRCYKVLLEKYYPPHRVLLSVLPAFMRYAGPREAIFHAIVRKNYGCTHFLVGRDHAGVGSYYGPYDAQEIFQEFGPEELGIQPMMFENSFHCRKCGSMATAKTCPHESDDHLLLSGTELRAMLARGEVPPVEYTRPEVAAILAEAYRNEG